MSSKSRSVSIGFALEPLARGPPFSFSSAKESRWPCWVLYWGDLGKPLGPQDCQTSIGRTISGVVIGYVRFITKLQDIRV
jgi:hypothetical protein